MLKDDTVYTSLATSATTLVTATDSARSLTASLAAFSGRLNQPGRLPHDLVSDEVTYPRLVASVSQLQHTADQVSVWTDGVVSGSADAGTPLGLLLNSQAAGKDLSVTLQQLNEGSALLSADAEALQDSFLLRGPFRRKARADAKKSAE